MSDHTTRVLSTAEHREADALFRASLHESPVTDEQWEYCGRAYQPGRALGVFDDELIGTTRSLDTTLVVGGGGEVPNAAVTGVGVRSDRTRRGALTELMREQLAGFAERGVVTANLHASEGAIYGRFGYGPATYARTCTVDRRRTALRPGIATGGEVRRVGIEEALARLPDIYSGLPAQRAGMLGRVEQNWRGYEHHARRADSPVFAAVHHGDAGPDGYVLYWARHHESCCELRIFDLQAANVSALAGLWRYLLGVDLVDRITLPARPVDEPTALLFSDPRSYREDGAEDETWLRIVDVAGALRAMRRDADPLVIEVTDRMLPGNTGRYLVTPDGVDRTDAPASMSLEVGTLAMIYLGAWVPSVLGEFGRISFSGAAQAATADRLFGTHHAPWCGTFF